MEEWISLPGSFFLEVKIMFSLSGVGCMLRRNGCTKQIICPSIHSCEKEKYGYAPVLRSPVCQNQSTKWKISNFAIDISVCCSFILLFAKLKHEM
jgi:hypothetical protein